MRKTVPAEWQAAILVCGKCSRKVKGGFGRKGRTTLAEALLETGNGRKGRKAGFGVVETRCLKLCPKGAVVAINGARPGEWHLVRPGTPIDAVAEELGLERRSR